MDILLKFMYTAMYRLDVDNCTEIIQPFSNLEVKVGIEKVDFSKFLGENSTMVSGEHFSTKDTAKASAEALAKEELGEYTDFLKNKYMEFNKIWTLFRYSSVDDGIKNKSIGYAELIQVHNGFPKFINTAEFAANPDIYNKKFNGRNLNNFLDDAFSVPETYKHIKVFLLTDFQKDFLISKDKKYN